DLESLVADQPIGGVADRELGGVKADESNLGHVVPGRLFVLVSRPGLVTVAAFHGGVCVDRFDAARNPLSGQCFDQAARGVVLRGPERLCSDELPDGGGGDDAATCFKPLCASLLEMVKDG